MQQISESQVNWVTNPHGFSYSGINFLGTSGQNIKDIRMYASALQEPSSCLDVIDLTLQMRHMFPTTPDTLRSFPFTGGDPFLLHDAPHVYFAGNQPQYGTRLIDSGTREVTRIISVPAFRKSKSIVIVDLESL